MNTGNWNTGEYNTGHRNTSGWNTGDWNTGHWNSGNRNTGDRNTGFYNTGDCNTGDYNTGFYNTGDCNTGDYNTGSRNTGSFNTITPDGAYFFNKWCSFEEWEKYPKPKWFFEVVPTQWVSTSQMTEWEKNQHPEHETTGGYLRVNDMKEEWRKAYRSATEEEIQMVRDLPNFDPNVFEEITGLDLRVN